MKTLLKAYVLVAIVICSASVVRAEDDDENFAAEDGIFRGLTALKSTKQPSETAPSIDDGDDYLAFLSNLDSNRQEKKFLDAFRNYVSKKPEDKRAVFLLAVHYLRGSKRELARYLLLQLQSDASFAWRSLVLNNLALLSIAEGNRFKALDLLEQASNSEPKVAAPLVNLGSLLLENSSYQKAEEAFEKALALDKSFEEAAQGLGVALEGQGKYEKAHEVYTSFMKSNDDASGVMYNDAVILGQRLDKKEEAANLMLRYMQQGNSNTARAQEFIQKWR